MIIDVASLLRKSFAGTAGMVEGFSTYGAILVNLNPSGRFTRSNKAIAASLALINSIIEAVSCNNFQGKEIENYLKNREDVVEIEEDGEQRPISRKRKTLYLLTRYGFLIISLLSDLGANCLLYSASKASIHDLSNGNNELLSTISHWELGCIVGYFVLLDLPFILTGEMAQTLKEMREQFNIKERLAPDRAFVESLQTVMQPVAKSRVCREIIRVSGSAADTFEHILALLLSIPIFLFLKVASLSSIWPFVVGTIGLFLLFTLIQECYLTTYWFEGGFVDQNLRAMANDDENYNNTPWVSYTLAKIVYFLLPTVAFLHGIGDWLTMVLGGDESPIPSFIIHPLAFWVFCISTLAYFFTEVVTGRKALLRVLTPVAANASTVLRNTGSPLADGSRERQTELEEFVPLKPPFEEAPTINSLPLPSNRSTMSV